MALITLCSPTLIRAEEPDAASSTGKLDVELIADIPYIDAPDADPKKQKLDLFVPKGKKDFPVVFFIHGGAWSSGDRKMYGSLGSVFARNGVGAVIISYRLSPQVSHPAHIEDVAAAFAWTKKNIARYGGRPDQIFVTGQSAGGHLAALLTTNEKYLAAHGLSPQDIRGCMPISGVYSFPGNRFRRVLGDDPEAPADASPVNHVSGNEPPFLILYADGDFPGCDLMSKQLGRELAEKKVESEVREIEGRNHISIMLRAMLSDTDPTSRALLDFVAKHSEEPENRVGGND